MEKIIPKKCSFGGLIIESAFSHSVKEALKMVDNKGRDH